MHYSAYCTKNGAEKLHYNALLVSEIIIMLTYLTLQFRSAVN